jgi:hypothetical protein
VALSSVGIGTTSIAPDTILQVVSNAIFNTVITVTNGYILPQLSVVPTNSLPAGSSSVTNWALINLQGIPMLVATNTSGGGILTKALYP